MSRAVLSSPTLDEARKTAIRPSPARAPVRVPARPLLAEAHEVDDLARRRAEPFEREAERVARGPLRSAEPPLRCACGGIPEPDGECAACKAKRLALQPDAARPEPDTEPGFDEEGPPVGRPPLPHQGDATIVCDGRGGYRVSLGWAATATCGIRDCVSRHEQSHASDWRGRWPNGCENADGTNKANGAAVPTGGAGYAAFLRQSECTAYGVEIPCEEALLRNATDACKPTIERVLADSRRQRTSYCASP